MNTLGYYVHSAIGRYLRQRYVPTILGFNPMMQFIHEEDVAEAVALALQKGAHGVFNVAGPGAVPLKVAISETGGTAVPLPEAIVAPALLRGSSSSGLYHTPPARWTSSSTRARSTAARFARDRASAPLFTPRGHVRERPPLSRARLRRRSVAPAT